MRSSQLLNFVRDTWEFTTFTLPPVWYEEDKIYDLLQEFKRRREVDPVAYDRKMKFWCNLIEQYARHHHVVVFSEAGLSSVFTCHFKSDGGIEKPQCLGSVLNELVNRGTLKYASNFQAGMLTKIVSWSWGLLSKGASTSSDPVGGELVDVEIANVCQNEFMNWLRSKSHLKLSPQLNILNMEDFDSLMKNYFPHEASRAFMKQFMVQNQLIIEETWQDGEQLLGVVKFGSDSKLVAPITSDERSQMKGIIKIQATIRGLENDTNMLVDRVEERRNSIRQLLKNNKKDDAKHLLRRTKLLEAALAQKRDQMHNLESMLVQIESASNNRQVIGALASAGIYLKTEGKNPLEVGDMVAELSDLIADNKEVSDSLANVQDDELAQLEQELDELLEDSPGKSKYSNSAGGRVGTDDALNAKLDDLDLSNIELPSVDNLSNPSSAEKDPGVKLKNLRAQLLDGE